MCAHACDFAIVRLFLTYWLCSEAKSRFMGQSQPVRDYGNKFRLIPCGSSRRPIAMMRTFHWRWAVSVALAWLAVTVLSALLPAEARAGCNHPWVTRAGQSGPLIDRAVLDPSSHPTIQEPESSPPADPQSPCAGGACSRAPNLPASSTVPVPNRAELWIDLGFARLSSNPGVSPFLSGLWPPASVPVHHSHRTTSALPVCLLNQFHFARGLVDARTSPDRILTFHSLILIHDTV